MKIIQQTYSEGNAFLDFKKDWRSFAMELWHFLQGGYIQLGKAEFAFDKYGKCYEVFRNNKLIWSRLD